MTLPASLSWMHLFGRETSFACDDSAPAWMRALVESANRPALNGTALVTGKSFASGHAFVGINTKLNGEKGNSRSSGSA